MATVMAKPLSLSKTQCEPFLPHLGCCDTCPVPSLSLGSLVGNVTGRGSVFGQGLRGERCLFLRAGAGFHSRFSLCRVLVQMCKTKAFRELCTPSPDLPQMVSTALKVLGVSPTPTSAGWDPVGLPSLLSPAQCPQLSKSTRITMAWEIPTPLQPGGPSLWFPPQVLIPPRGQGQ